jgi:ribonuclease R
MAHQPSGADTRRDALLASLRQAEGKPLSVRELMQRARIGPGERTAVKRALRDLTRDGVLARDGKRFSLPSARPARPSQPVTLGPSASREAPRSGQAKSRGPVGRRRGIVGTLTRHRDGYGFVARLDRQGDDVFVPPDEAGKALDGDLVRVEIVPAPRGRTMGRIVEVVERRRRWLLGTYHARSRSSFVVPLDVELEGYVGVPETTLAQDGEVVKVALDPGTGKLSGRVMERVGRPGDPRVEVLKVAYAKGFSDLFPEDVQAEAAGVPDHVRPEDRRGRRDLTSLRLVTIDGEDARDFDDAVYVERVRGKGGARYRLVVAIADVAHYVRPGSALDAEAVRRGTSVYFPAQVLPMLPERLSNGICSLNPAVDRLCMVADLLIDDHGQPVSAELYEGVMRSAARCTYTEVARVLAGEKVPHREAFRKDFELMAELQAKLTAMRARRGAIDFDLPESKVVLGDDGRVVAIERRPRNRAHRVVEEFMLAANEAVARQFSARDLPTIYRVHGLPDEEKLDAFRKLARAHGFEVPDGPLGPKQLNALLHEFEGHAQQRALNQLLLRAMMQALYTAENIGHYGLAAEHYLHFTSPIRRYPDLMVHRLLKEAWAHGQAPGKLPTRDLEEIATLASERERAAMQAEREISAFYAALFMQDKVGERFRGVVASVVEFGLFVEIEPWFVEGLVKLTDLGEGFELDPELHALVQSRTGRAFRVGDRVDVEVASASPARRQIDLRLVEAGEVVEGVPAQAWPERAHRPRLDRGRRPKERKAPGKRVAARKHEHARGGRPGRGGGGPKKKGRGGRRR